MSLERDQKAVSNDAIGVVNLREAFGRFQDHWSPKVAGQINDMQVKLVKLQGEFVWHHHEQEDELFLVVRGRLLLRLRDRELWLEEGEFAIIPHGVEHQPVAEEEVQVLLLEPAGTLNTGNVSNERTVRDLEQLR
jgi:mannose-6-phosphate isomerase-like protein (cupin superfamily)